MMRSTIVCAFILLGFVGTSITGWYAGRNYQRLVSSQEFATELTAKPLGSETVGFKPLRELPILKQIEFTINGVNRRFVVGEIRTFEVKRYGVKSELVLDANDVAIAEIVRVTEMNKWSSFTKPDDCYQSRTCPGMNPLAVYTSAFRDLRYVKAQRFLHDPWGRYDGYVLNR